MPDADPRIALENLLEVRFHMQRAAWVQRDFVRLKPETRDPYPSGSTRDQFGSGTMADDLLNLADHLDNIVFGLDRASAYFWTDAMTAVIMEAATRMPRYTFTKSSFPTPEGFVWHASPHKIDRIVPEGELSSDDQVNMFFEAGREGTPVFEPRPLQAWGWRRDVKDGPDSVECLSWHYNRTKIIHGEDEWRLHRNFRVRYGETLEDVVERTGGRDWKAFGMIVACALALMEQKLLVPGRVHVPRALEKRYQHSLKSLQAPNLQIVELRRRETLPASPYEPRDVEWQHRWFVSRALAAATSPNDRRVQTSLRTRLPEGPRGEAIAATEPDHLQRRSLSSSIVLTWENRWRPMPRATQINGANCDRQLTLLPH